MLVSRRSRHLSYGTARGRSKLCAGGLSLVALACSACTAVPEPGPVSFCDLDARSAIAATVDAHGGNEAWYELRSLYVEREHHFAGTDQSIRFNILGEYPSFRIFQEWQVPPGTLAWDGERAWSSNWPLAARLPPAYVAGIGFTLVNTPWFALEHANRLESLGCGGTLPTHGDRKFLVVVAHYEPDPVRKPNWYDGPRNRYELYLDPETHRLVGVNQHWTHAGRLDAAGLPENEHEIEQLFVAESYVDVGGLTLPERYTAYEPDGTVAARGRFFDYDLSRPFDVTILFPDDTTHVDYDLSSSYFRSP